MIRIVALAALLLAPWPALAQSPSPVPSHPSGILMPKNNAARPGAASVLPNAGAETARVNVNTATAAQLDAIPQIGPARAKAIIAHRPYSRPSDLVRKKVLPRATYEKIRDRLATR